MTETAPASPRKRLILARAFQEKLGGISTATLLRLQKTDPRFPQPSRLRHMRVWAESAADAYVDQVLADALRQRKSRAA